MDGTRSGFACTRGESIVNDLSRGNWETNLIVSSTSVQSSRAELFLLIVGNMSGEASSSTVVAPAGMDTGKYDALKAYRSVSPPRPTEYPALTESYTESEGAP